MPVIRHVRVTPREAEQLREIRVNSRFPNIDPAYVDELRALLLRIEQDALGVQSTVLPHDFITHRDAWRKALVLCMGQARHDDVLYWKHELKAFDVAYAELTDGVPSTSIASSNNVTGG